MKKKTEKGYKGKGGSLPPSCRRVAFEVLLSWRLQQSSIDSLIEKSPAVDDLNNKDRQLFKAIVYGVLRWQDYLDWVVSRFSKHPLKKIKPHTLAALHVGIFQLLFLDRIPPSAAINETVEAYKKSGQPKWLVGFVNGLLREINRNRDSIAQPGAENDLSLAIRYSHPQWLVQRWNSRYGNEQCIQMLKNNQTETPLCLRVNTQKLNRDSLRKLLSDHGIENEPGLYTKEAIRLVDYRGSIPALPGYTDGLFHIQDESAQLIPMLAAPLQQGCCLDACAGLGGKTITLAQLFPKIGLTAIEPQQDRLKKLSQNLNRILGLSNKVTIFPGSIEAFAQTRSERFDAILLDAPCSGIGVIGRNPDIRWNRNEEDFAKFQAQQISLLNNAAALLKQGGVLVYATCSTEPEENNEVVTAFIDAHPEMSLTNAAEFLPTAAHCLVNAKGCLQTLPGRHGNSDGFFAARLVKAG